MTEITNAYDANTASFTLKTYNYLPVAPGSKEFSYQDLDGSDLGKASPQIHIAILKIGDAPVSGDFSQGLPAGPLVGTSTDVHTTVLVDTGSFNTVLPKSLFAKYLSDEDLAKYPAATISYSSDDNTGTGVWVPMEIALFGADGTYVAAKIPVVVQTSGETDHMMGVGFNIGRSIVGSMPDTSTYANAFLNIEPTADGSTLSQGYVIDKDGIHLGLTAADTSGDWAMQKLQPSPRATPAGAPPDWQPPTISGTVDYPTDGTAAASSFPISPSGLLVDTGVTKTFIKTHESVPEPGDGSKVSLNLFGTAGQVGYSYVLGGSSLQQPTTDTGSAVGTGAQDADRANLLNTGVHLLSGFDYLYDAANGYVGLRSNAAAGHDDLSITPMVAVSGDYPMADGFAVATPLYVAGDSTLAISGTATLAGGVEGPGTLTLNSGTLVLSGTSTVGRTIAVAGGSTLDTGAGGNTVNVMDRGTVLSRGSDWINGGSGATAVSILGSGSTVVGGAGALAVTGGGGNNTVFAGSGGLSYQSGAGFDTVVGLGKAMTATGGTGGGQFFGGGNATITAGAGGDLNVVVGGNGDKLYATGPKGVLFGTSGGDVLMSSAADTGSSVFFGANGTGHMTFITGAGDDMLALGQGSNDVTLGAGHAVIFGNGGHSSATTITVGSGSLDLAFSGASTVLNITAGTARNFNLYSYGQGQESIHLESYGAGEAANALATQQSVGGGTVLSLSDGSMIALAGVHSATASLFS